ncbi:unnamed protein product [Blepharisma stoltei]|uniref:Dynein light chain n=1 Tax=Blepharisma stoltei TaxID=1481888 RepID=A0AAU9J0Z6_9CILI|nr:unnamed protein product [Blepharisma stoltei]
MVVRRAFIKTTDMTEEEQQDAVFYTSQAVELFNTEREIANYIKQNLENKYKPNWHCIVGRNFSIYLPNDLSHFIYFYFGQIAIWLFKHE